MLFFIFATGHWTPYIITNPLQRKALVNVSPLSTLPLRSQREQTVGVTYRHLGPAQGAWELEGSLLEPEKNWLPVWVKRRAKEEQEEQGL